MKTASFPNCCTATVLYDFGGTHISGLDRQPTNENDLRTWIQERMRYATGSGRLYTAITNSDQKVAAKVLRGLGFSCTKWMSKQQHSETKMRLWWKQA